MTQHHMHLTFFALQNTNIKTRSDMQKTIVREKWLMLEVLSTLNRGGGGGGVVPLNIA